MLHNKKNNKFALLGFLLTLVIVLFFSTKSIAQSNFIRIITDDTGIVNFLAVDSIKNQGQQKFYTAARVAPTPATNDYSLPLRRPYHGQKCACPYDYAINGSICGGRSSGKTTCFAPTKTKTLLLSNSVNCQTKIRSIYSIQLFDSKDKPITTYTAQRITGGAYPVEVEVSDPAELKVINAVCSRK